MSEVTSKLSYYCDYLAKTSSVIKRYVELSNKKTVDCSEEEVAEVIFLMTLKEVGLYNTIIEILKKNDYTSLEEQLYKISLLSYIKKNNQIPYSSAYIEERTWYFSSILDKPLNNEYISKVSEYMNKNGEVLWYKRYYELLYYVLIKGCLPDNSITFYNDKLTMIKWFKMQCLKVKNKELDNNKTIDICNIRILSNALKEKIGLKVEDGIDVGYELSNIRTIIGSSKRAFAKEIGISYNRVSQAEGNDGKKNIDVLFAYQKESDKYIKESTDLIGLESLKESYDKIDEVISSKITNLVLKNNL